MGMSLSVAQRIARPLDAGVHELGQRMRRRARRVYERAALVERAAATVMQSAEDLEERGAWLEREGAAGVLRAMGGTARRLWWLGLLLALLLMVAIWLRRRGHQHADAELAADPPTIAPATPPTG